MNKLETITVDLPQEVASRMQAAVETGYICDAGRSRLCGDA